MAKNVKIYTTDFCGYCNRAKSFMKDKKIEFTEIYLSRNDPKRQTLIEETGFRTLPLIMIEEEVVGGFTDLVELYQSGILAKMLDLELD